MMRTKSYMLVTDNPHVEVFVRRDADLDDVVRLLGKLCERLKTYPRLKWQMSAEEIDESDNAADYAREQAKEFAQMDRDAANWSDG